MDPVEYDLLNYLSQDRETFQCADCFKDLEQNDTYSYEWIGRDPICNACLEERATL